MPVEIASPTSTSAELHAGGCVVTDKFYSLKRGAAGRGRSWSRLGVFAPLGGSGRRRRALDLELEVVLHDARRMRRADNAYSDARLLVRMNRCSTRAASVQPRRW
jgi:hypothetical protein